MDESHTFGKCVFDLKTNLGHSDQYFTVQWISFIFCSEKHFSFIGRAQFRRSYAVLRQLLFMLSRFFHDYQVHIHRSTDRFHRKYMYVKRTSFLDLIICTCSCRHWAIYSSLVIYSSARGFFFNFPPIPVGNKTEWKIKNIYPSVIPPISMGTLQWKRRYFSAELWVGLQRGD